MGQLVSLELYREKQLNKQDNEIKRLQAELNELIENMGGITTGPICQVTSVYNEQYSAMDSLHILTNPAMWYNFEYLVQDTKNEK
jgi:hypothetical protein|tara:strand:- start:150 stop:404 length:255 start_codon:yes stop_codon:yes gene_type:complete